MRVIRQKADEAREELRRMDEYLAALFMILANMMQLRQEEGSLMWRLADVLFDVARLGFAVIVGVWAVRNVVILVTVPKAKDVDD